MVQPRHRAQSMTEYIIIVGLVAIGLIGAVRLFGGQLQGLFGVASQKLSSEVDVSPTPAGPPAPADPNAAAVQPEAGGAPPTVPEGELIRENPYVWDSAAHNGRGGFKHRDGAYVSASAVREAGFDPSKLIPMDHPMRAELLR